MNRNTYRIVGVVLATSVSTAAFGLTGSGASAATGDSASKRQPSQAVVAKKLAARVARARTPNARYKAILAVMRTLHVGVVTGKGKAVVRGGRPHEVYLYDFEIEAMAGALGRRQTNTAAELARRLSAAGVRPGGNPLTAEQLAQKLKAGTRAVLSRKRSRLSLAPLLARELGLRQRAAYDLATAPTDKQRFDALQTFLIGADLAVAASRQRGAASKGASTTIARQGTSGSAAAVCQGAEGLKEFMPLGKWLIGFIKQLSGPVKAVNITIDAIHGPILAFSVAVTNVGPTSQRTHYGPAGHDADAGKPVDFRVRVVMRDALPDWAIECGALIGMKFPKKGPIPGVTVTWPEDSAIASPMTQFGTVTYPTGTKTGANGETSLHFVPKDERFPGFGSLHYAGNTKRAVALYQSAFGNVPGSLAQLLTPKEVRFPWTVAFHHPRGFKLAGMVRDNWFTQWGKPVGEGDPGPGDPAGRVDVDLHVCGDDPFAPWTGTITSVSEGTPLKFPHRWAFVPDVPTSPVNSSYGTTQSGLQGQLNLTPPFSANFMGYNFLTEGWDGPFSLPLEEAGWQECPDNTPVGVSP